MTSAALYRSFDYLVADTPYSRGWLQAVRRLVPSKHRDWNGKVWSFRLEYYELVLAITEHFFIKVTDQAGEITVKQVQGWQSRWEKYRDSLEYNDHRATRGDVVVEAYGVLFLLPTAPAEVVQAAYRALSKKYHPDAGSSSDTKIKEVNSAMDILKRHGRAR